MTAIDAPQPLVRPIRHRGLRREIGFIGLLWVSGGSIIGSGWLFSAQGALAAAGPAALISWVIGGVAILLVALVHAELGAMYPVAGGTARFPHIAFGGAAGASFGWFLWLQAVTVEQVALPTGEIERLIATVPEEAPDPALEALASGPDHVTPEHDRRVVQGQAD